MEDWGAVRARLKELRYAGISVQLEADVNAALERVEELELVVSAGGLIHWTMRAEAAEAKLARCVEALRECQRVFDHPAFTDRAGIGDVCRAALAAAKGE